MTYIAQDITIRQGEDLKINSPIYDENNTLIGSLASFSFLWRLTTDPTDRSAIVEKTTGGGGIALDTPASSYVQITILDTDTEDLPSGTYWQELRATDSGGLTNVAFAGWLTLEPSNSV